MISIITPTYNERESLPHYLKQITAYLASLREQYEIIIVDDNSPDGTGELVNSLKLKYPQLTLLKRIGKKGIGSAYFDGYKKARGNIVIGIDADLSQSLKSIPLFIKNLKEGKSDMVIASRYLPASKVYNQTPFRRWGSRVFNIFLYHTLSVPVFDITHSYRGFKKSIIKKIANDVIETDHPSFFIELTFLTIKNGYKVNEVPTVFKERKYGYSKLNIIKGVKAAVKTVVRLKIL